VLTLAADGGALVLLQFDGSEEDGSGDPGGRDGECVEPDERVLDAAQLQLAEYFAGEREDFDLPLAPRGSPFQRRVWLALREIPYGTTTTYGVIADRLGLPAGSARAIGLANGQNPIAVVVPCHRVIGADGGLTGFGGGIERKEVLLALEGSALF
jgi:methylated-DNA-[protein]-cysteine S-methyltransferase